jgi:hypothetical protein
MSSTISSINPDSHPQQASISIADLQNLLIVIDLATTRGAFRGPELSQVGQVFDKLNQFVQSVTPPADTAATTATQSGAPVQQMAPTPVMPMTPPFTPKVGL